MKFIFLAGIILLLSLVAVNAEVCVQETQLCYGTVAGCVGNATSGQTCVITDSNTYTEPQITINKDLTLTHNATTGQPTINGSTSLEPILSIGNYSVVIQHISLNHNNGQGILYDQTGLGGGLLTIFNTTMDINCASGCNNGDGGAFGVYVAGGLDHVIDNNDITVNGSACCNYAVHVDANNANEPTTAFITNNILLSDGDGTFDGGITFYGDNIVRQGTFHAENNTITTIERAAGANAFSFGIFSDFNFTTKNNVIDVRGIGSGTEPMAGIWVETSLSTVETSVVLEGDTITVNDAGILKNSSPIVGVQLTNLTIRDATFTNNDVSLDVMSNNYKNSLNCYFPAYTYIENPTWSEDVSNTDLAWVNAGNLPCGEIHVTYDVTVSTGVDGATVDLSSQNPDALNPTNTVSGTADASGDYSANIGARYYDNVTYFAPSTLNFMPYDVNVSATGYESNSTTETITNGDTVISVLLAVIPPVVIPASETVPLANIASMVAMAGLIILIFTLLFGGKK